MSDLAKEILNAPLGTILILAGLAFLAIGIVGKIKGKIEPGTWGRVLAGIAGLVFLGIGLAMHLGGEEKEGNDEEPEKLPTINLSIARFSADPLRIQSGEQSTLSWETRNASEVTIEGIGDVAETGSTGVSPRRTTTYELTASDGAGGTKTARLTVQVSKDTTEASAPTISAFVVKPDQIKKGECTLLGWRTSGAVSVELRPGGTVALSGSQEIRPLKSTRYTLIARNSQGRTAEQTVTVTVKQTSSSRIHTKGRTVIQGNWLCDLDSGKGRRSREGSDFFWQDRTPQRLLVPYNNARFRVLGRKNFDSVSHDDLRC